MSAPATNRPTAIRNSACETVPVQGAAVAAGDSRTWCETKYATQPTIHTIRQRSRRVRNTKRLAARMSRTAISRATSLGTARPETISHARQRIVFICRPNQLVCLGLARGGGIVSEVSPTFGYFGYQAFGVQSPYTGFA